MNQAEIMEIKDTCGSIIKHIKTDGLYWVLEDLVKVKIDGEWVDFIQYQNVVTEEFYCRLPSDFSGFESLNAS